MRRLRILLYWFFYSKNNVTFKELLQFLAKPKVSEIAKRYLRGIVKNEDFYEVTFKDTNEILYWPLNFSIEGINQVTAETFDALDWHFYQYKNTMISHDEVLLDIGTAEGLFPLTVIDKCKHVFLIEPSSSFYSSLIKTFEPFKEKVTIFKAAVGNEDGEIGFDENSLMGQVSTDSGVGKIQIRKIDSLIGSQKITYLKADIEGFEYEMLKGAAETIRNNKPKIAITTYHGQNNPDEIITLIKSYVPEYKYIVKGIHGEEPKPVMIHFWI